MSTVFTFPGKMGDALMQWPVAYQWAKKTGQKFQVWMDEQTCAPLVKLFEAQPCVESVKLIGGVENWNCGGQPFHMNLPTSAFEDHTVYHLGLRNFPARQITLQTLNDVKLNVEIDKTALAEERSLHTKFYGPENRLVIHGQGVCPHNRTTPTVWKFLSGIREELESIFGRIYVVGSPDDREVARMTYPNWGEFDDGGSFYELAKFIADSRAVIACGSSVAAMAGALKVPCIRVHDVVGNDCPKVIWTNLGRNQLNETEIGLRKEWPKWRDKWLGATVEA